MAGGKLLPNRGGGAAYAGYKPAPRTTGDGWAHSCAPLLYGPRLSGWEPVRLRSGQARPTKNGRRVR